MSTYVNTELDAPKPGMLTTTSNFSPLPTTSLSPAQDLLLCSPTECVPSSSSPSVAPAVLYLTPLATSGDTPWDNETHFLDDISSSLPLGSLAPIAVVPSPSQPLVSPLVATYLIFVGKPMVSLQCYNAFCVLSPSVMCVVVFVLWILNVPLRIITSV